MLFKNIFKKLNTFHSAIMWHPIQLTRRRGYGTGRRTVTLGTNLKVIRIGCLLLLLAPMGVISGSLDDNIQIRNVGTHAKIEDALQELSS